MTYSVYTSAVSQFTRLLTTEYSAQYLNQSWYHLSWRQCRLHEGAQLWQPLLLLDLHSVLELKTRSVVLGCEGRVETIAKELQKLLSYALFFAAHVSSAFNKGSSRVNYWEGSNWVCCVSIIKSKHTHTPWPLERRMLKYILTPSCSYYFNQFFRAHIVPSSKWSFWYTQSSDQVCFFWLLQVQVRSKQHKLWNHHPSFQTRMNKKTTAANTTYKH